VQDPVQIDSHQSIFVQNKRRENNMFQAQQGRLDADVCEGASEASAEELPAD